MKELSPELICKGTKFLHKRGLHRFYASSGQKLQKMKYYYLQLEEKGNI